MIALLLPTAILFVGAVVQGAMGFAFGLVCISLLILTGIPLPSAMIAVGVAVLFQTLWLGWKYRTHAPGKEIALLIGVAYVGIVIGVCLLRVIAGIHPSLIKAIVGLVLVVILLFQSFCHIQPRASIPKAWGWLAYGSGGFLCGLVGMGGPPVVLWVSAHDWPAVRMRVALWISMCALVPVQGLMLYARFGWEMTSNGIKIGLIALPAVLVGTWLGARMGDRFSKKVLRKLIFALLWLIAGINLVAPFV
jgi:uncharacterized protein